MYQMNKNGKKWKLQLKGIKNLNWQSWILIWENSDVWKWLDLPTRCPLFLPPKGLARFGTTSSTVVSKEYWVDVERLMAPYHLRILNGPWSGCGPVTFQLPIPKGQQSQAKVSSRGFHWDKIITGQCNISRMKLSQSVLGLSSQSCSSGSGSISLGPGWLVGKSGWEVSENRPA